MTRNPVGDNEPFSAAYWSAITNAHDFEYVHDGLIPTKGTGAFDVDTTAGNIQLGDARVAVAAQVTTLTAADPTNPRVDLITCDGTGNVQATAGTPAANPAAPDIPAGHALVGVVFVPAGATEIVASDIYDYRVLGRFDDYPIVAADIDTGAVGSDEIATDAVGASEIAAGAVGSSEVADNSLTASDLATITSSTYSQAEGYIREYTGNSGSRSYSSGYSFDVNYPPEETVVVKTLRVKATGAGVPTSATAYAWDGTTATTTMSATGTYYTINFPNHNYLDRVRLVGNKPSSGSGYYTQTGYVGVNMEEIVPHSHTI